MPERPLVLRASLAAATVAVSLLLCAGVLELSLRLFWDGYYQKFHPDRPWGEFEFHPTRGFALARNLEMVDWDADFKVVLRHNSQGFRGPEIPAEKPPGRIRVLAIGDSMVYGLGVENEEAFPAVLERLEPRLEVINAGVPAYGGPEELLLLREEIGELDPDVVLAAYFWNDLLTGYQGQYARFELHDGALVQILPEPASPEHPAFAFRHRRHERQLRRYGFIARESYLYRLVSDRWKILSFAIEDWRRSDEDRNRDAADGSETFGPEQRERAWEVSFALLAEMARVAESHGARFAILVIPDSSQVEPDTTVYGLPEHVPRVQARVTGFARSAGIPVVEPLGALREIRRREGIPLFHPTDRHWNARGHEHVARILREELRRLGVVPAPPG